MNGVLRERGAEFNASPRIKPQNSAISQNQLKSLKSSTPYRVSPHRINNKHCLLAVVVGFGREGLRDFGWSLKTEVMGGFDFCDAKMLREGCFKKYIQAPLIGMRIWFGLILKIMVRMKSYVLPELCYLTKSIGKYAKLQFFSGSLPSCSS